VALALSLLAVGVAHALTPVQAAPQAVQSEYVAGLRAADDASRVAAALCSEIWAAADETGVKALLDMIREATDSAREQSGDLENAVSASLREMLRAKPVTIEMLDRLRRATETWLAGNGRVYAAAAVESLTEPCVAARRAGAPKGVSTPTINQASVNQAITELQPVFRRLADNLVLLDQTLRLSLSRGGVTAPQADAVLREWATGLALRDLTKGLDAGLASDYKAEAQTYLQALVKLVPTVTKWPPDRPADEYANLSKAMLKQISDQYTADFARGFVPTTELAEAQLVSAWTRGESEVTPAHDVFVGQPDRVMKAIGSAMPAVPADAQSAPAPADPAALPAPPASPKVCKGFDGTWSTNYGDVILRVTGDQFEGENPSYRARVKGRVTGQTLAGVRTIAGYADAAIKFVLAADGAKFDGTVDIAPGRSITWKGACGGAGSVPASR
jgi:hypothetical protein